MAKNMPTVSKPPVKKGWVDVVGLGTDEFRVRSNLIPRPKPDERSAETQAVRPADRQT
jgi:hypothetical protein